MDDVKKRTMNEMRQVKDTIYRPPLTHTNIRNENVEIDPIHVVELIKNFHNDQQLGYELRRYYLKLCGKL